MSAAIPFHKHSVGRTFMVALCVLGVGALVQFAALSWLFLTRYRSPQAEEKVAVPPSPAIAATREFSDPFVDSGTPAAANLPANQPPPKPTPAPVVEPRPSTGGEMSERLAELLEQGRMLRERNDTYAALTKLREAEAMAEQDPQPTAEVAMTYEKMGFAEKAAESWRRIYEMGEAAGVYYAAAEGRLRASQAAALKGATTGEGSEPAAGGATPEAAPVGRAEQIGLNGNCKLGLKEITRQEEADPSAKKKFVLRVPVRARPRARIDVHDVIVQVVFYDIVNGKALDRTSATVTYKWSAPPADWADDDVEVLEVTYLLPELRVADEDRKYYGYLVSLYYKNALQDFRSEPTALGQRAAPPVALQDSSP